jgi:hypothetical protein
MFRIFIIWITLGWISFILAQSFGDNFKLAYPNLVHQGESFEISIITSNELENADELNLYIIPESGIKLDEVIFQSEFESKEVEFSNASSERFLYEAVMCSIDLTQFASNESNSFFQLLLKFKSEFIDYSEIEFYGEFRKDNRIVHYLKNSSNELLSDYPNFYRVKINFYASVGIGEKALLLPSRSEFSIHPDIDIENDMLADFWIMLDHNRSPFLEIKNKQTGLVEYRLVRNEFQILTSESDFHLEKNIYPHFIPNNVWIHFSILFSFNNKKIEFFCNGKEFSEFELPASISVSDLIIRFINTDNGSYKLDQFRILDFDESIDASFNNRHYYNFISDKSEVKLQFSFNKTTQTELMQNEFVSLNNIELVSSDAPIFSRAPELNLNIMNNYYELNWLGGDYTNAAAYVVEQAKDEGGFFEIYRTEADNLNEKKYSFLSERINNSEVIYYRIKQISKDGSVVYSSQVKVGQGELEEFVIGQNYPNPFNPSTQIPFEVLIDSDFEIVVYNLEGKRVSILYQGFLAAGEYQFTFDGSELPSGIYLYKAWSTNFSQTKKMILAK